MASEITSQRGLDTTTKRLATVTSNARDRSGNGLSSMNLASALKAAARSTASRAGSGARPHPLTLQPTPSAITTPAAAGSDSPRRRAQETGGAVAPGTRRADGVQQGGEYCGSQTEQERTPETPVGDLRRNGRDRDRKREHRGAGRPRQSGASRDHRVLYAQSARRDLGGLRPPDPIIARKTQTPYTDTPQSPHTHDSAERAAERLATERR